MAETSVAIAALLRVLDCVRADLVFHSDAAGADRVLDLMTAAVAADEVMLALGREDAEAAEFHTRVLQRRLKSACQPGFDTSR